MHKFPSSAYICWRCLSRRPARTAASLGRQGGSSFGARGLVVARGLATVQSFEIATTNADLILSGLQDEETRPPGERLLESLRQWELNNPRPGTLSNKQVTHVSISQFSNVVQTNDKDIIRNNMEMDDAPRAMFDSGDRLDLRGDSTGLEAGDLFELLSDRWSNHLLAVCLGEFHGVNHFYTENGTFFVGSTPRTNFVVKRFARPEELQPIISALPKEAITPELLRTVNDLQEGPSREVASALIRKIHTFQLTTRMYHLGHITRLSEPLKYLGHITGSKETIISLSELADALLWDVAKRNGKHPAEALYAVHTALARDWLLFRVISSTSHQQSYLFEAAAPSDVDLADEVEAMVRELYDDIAMKQGMVNTVFLEKHPLGRFLLMARNAIGDSRKRRSFTPYGLLTPSAACAPPLPPQPWEPVHYRILRFMHLWSAEERLSPGSRLHWIGSAILRLIGSYDEEFLSPAIGWMFLQEIGWVKPWDIQARYSLRLPGIETTRSGSIKVQTTRQQDGPLFGPDKHAGNRRSFDSCTVFCIDSASTVDIDDGISIEPTDKSDEFWVHVHVADPTSRIEHDSVLAERASLHPRVVYLSGHHERMWGEAEIRDAFSLGPGKPCLTFSARINKKGDMLESAVTPGSLGDIVYMDTHNVDGFLGKRDMLPSDVTPPFAVGTPPSAAEEPRNRPMTDPASLSDEQKSQLGTLAELMMALKKKRAAKGAIPHFFPRPKVDVSFDNTVVQESEDGFMACSGDPYIRISYATTVGGRVIADAMVLAGEVAAQWCSARDIPIPYLVQPKAARNKEALDEYTRDVFYPQLEARRRPAESEYRRMRTLMGGTDLSTKGGANYAMGVDLYTRATSPLRRFTDLLLHWQITAALVEERRTGRSLVNSRQVPDHERPWLPFSHNALEHREFPQLRVREIKSKMLDGQEGRIEWILQALVRAWKLGDEPTEGGPLPATFRYKVGNDAGHYGFLVGEIDWFELRAILLPEDLTASGMLLADVRGGDEFEVELKNVNVYWKRIHVKVLRLLSRSGEGNVSERA